MKFCGKFDLKFTFRLDPKMNGANTNSFKVQSQA